MKLLAILFILFILYLFKDHITGKYWDDKRKDADAGFPDMNVKDDDEKNII